MSGHRPSQYCTYAVVTIASDFISWNLIISAWQNAEFSLMNLFSGRLFGKALNPNNQ
jgi:hypothetical protein